MPSRKRKDGESFEDYRASLKAESKLPKRIGLRWLHKLRGIAGIAGIALRHDGGMHGDVESHGTYRKPHGPTDAGEGISGASHRVS